MKTPVYEDIEKTIKQFKQRLKETNNEIDKKYYEEMIHQYKEKLIELYLLRELRSK